MFTMRKQISGVLLALLTYIPASAQIGQEAFGNEIRQTANGTVNPVADFSARFHLNAGATYTNDGTIYWLNTNITETFTVNGTYMAGSAATDYFGKSASNQNMEIAGTNAPVFNNLIFRNGQMTVTNAKGITVNSALTLENGITVTQRSSALDNSIRINNSGAASLNGSFTNTRHVDGYVSRKMNAAGNYLFPVGDEGKYRPVNYTPVASAAYVSLAYLGGTPPQGTASLASGLAAVSPVGSWQVAGAVNGAVSVSIPDMSAFAVSGDLRLVGWNGAEWIVLGNSATGNTEGSLLSGNVSSGPAITALGVGSVNAPLPVTLGMFTVKFEANAARLYWETHSEKNNEYFQILRSSNSKDWQPIGRVNGTGTTSGKSSYQFTDSDPLGGISYYRLRQFDFDGTSMLSSIRSVTNPKETAKQLHVYPNPTSGRFTMELPASGKIGKVTLLNMTGNQVNIFLTKNETTYEIVGQNMVPGIYILQVEKTDGSIESQKIVVQN
jgi:hypothetical protein